jgi:hypothetical protein
MSLLSSKYKIHTKLLKIKFGDKIMDEVQDGFCRGRSSTDGYFSRKLLIEIHRECSLQTHMTFTDLKKAFDKS